jgi:ribosomal RNA assembly protein
MSLDKDRIAVVIGKNGETKKLLEDKTGTKIIINSDTGEYQLEPITDLPAGDENNPVEPEEVRRYATDQILRAINYGFNPMKALKLLEADYAFEIIDLESILGHSEKKITRVKGRLIGEEGKIRSAIEELSNVNISVYKKFIAIIGSFEEVKIAKKAISMILQGAPHKTVLNYLKKEFEDKKKEDFKSMWKPVL